MKRVILLWVATAFLVACQDRGIQSPSLFEPSALIVDGASGGNPGFFFLPPLVGNPDKNLFGVFDRDAIVTVEICRQDVAQGACEEIVATFHPSEIDGASDHFHVSLDVSTIVTNNSNDDEFFRINVVVGNSVAGIVADLGSRDIAVNSSDPTCGDQTHDVLCVDPGTSVQIKFRVDANASCFTPNVTFPDPDCANTTVFGGGATTATGNLTAQITAPGTISGDPYALRFQQVPFPECDLGIGGTRELGLQDGATFHSMQWAQFPICYQVSTATLTGENVDINTLVDGLAEYFICFDDPGETFAREDFLRIARRSLDGSELQILKRSDPVAGLAVCIDSNSSLGGRLMNLASGFLNTVRAPFAPEPLEARVRRRRRDRGVGGLGLMSIIGVVYPGTMDAIDLVDGVVDLGAVFPGQTLTDLAAVVVEDSVGVGVEGNQVTFTPSDGDAFEGSTVATDVVSSGIAGSAGGDWTIAANATGTRTLTASCFPCGGDFPPVTGGNTSDLFPDFDPLTSANEQVITFTAVVLDLSIEILDNPRPAVDEPFPVLVCIGADVVDVKIEFIGRANNGKPTVVSPSDIVTPAGGFDAGGNGCMTILFSVSKSGGVRIVATLLDGDGNPIEVEESAKVNIKPK